MLEQNIAFWENLKQFFVAQQEQLTRTSSLAQRTGMGWTEDYVRHAHDQYQLAIDNCDTAIRNLQAVKR